MTPETLHKITASTSSGPASADSAARATVSHSDAKAGNSTTNSDVPLPHTSMGLRSRALWIAGAYATLATLWILFSDKALGALLNDPDLLVRISIYKGLGFVAVTAVMLLYLMREAFGKIESGYASLQANKTEIERLNRLYAALSHINRAIVRAPDRQKLFDEICQILITDGEFILAWIGWNDPATHRLMPVAVAGDENDYIRDIQVYTDDRPEGQGPAGRAFRENQPRIVNDMFQDPGTLAWRDEIRRRGLRACAAFPVHCRGKICATLTVHSRDPGFFTKREISLLEEAAVNVSFALDNFEREYERLRVQAVALNEKLFSDMMIESMPGILYFYTDEGRFLRWNKNFESLSGYSGEEIAQMHPLDFFASTDKRPLEKRIADVFAMGESHIEAPFLSKSGQATPYYFTGRRVLFEGRPCLVGVGIDISERTEAENARRSSEARYRTLFEHAPDGIVIADPESRYIDANDSICRMLGYTRKEMIGLHASDIVIPGEIPKIETAIDTIHARVDYHREWTFQRKDGSTFPAEVIATLMPDGNLMGMIRDISERKRAERELHELNETLELRVLQRTQELEAALVRAEAADRIKSAFLATMSHELRTPLNSIIGFTGIILQELAGPLNPEQHRQLGMVRGSARHLLELINDVLDLSKIEAGQLEVRTDPFDLRESIERVVNTVTPLAGKKGLELTFEAPKGPFTIVSDRRRVEQILLNLLNNALKFTDHGYVLLTADRVLDYKRTQTSASESAVRICVKDTGIGIAPHELEMLFQPFRQIDTGLARQHEGTGLGLAICRRLATLMGGNISASSRVSAGSEFTVILPSQPLHNP